MNILPLFAAGMLGSVYGVAYTRAGPSLWRTMLKAGCVAMIALWALANGAHWLLILALLFCVLGDVLLAQEDPDRWLIPGIGAFIGANVSYIFLFNRELPNGIVTDEKPQLILLAVSAVFLGLVSGKLGSMRWPALVYAVIILAMGCAALSLPEGYEWAKIGALAFIVSDALLVLEMFVISEDAPVRKVTSPLLWFLYWGAQAAIAYAFIF